jgi:N-sulfoglucosamine sulfohydrolase
MIRVLVLAIQSYSHSRDRLILDSSTGGASVAYQKNEAIGGNQWMLYTADPLDAGTVDSLAATAIRIGYKQSSVSRYPGTQ